MAKASFSGAVRWAFVMNAGQQGAAAVITFVLAGLLGPTAFGVVAMALVYLEFFHLFLGQGLAGALIQRETRDPLDLDTAFWMVMAATALLVAAAVGGAWFWASFNRTPELTAISLALAPTLLFKGLVVVHQADLQKQMDFRSLAIRSNVAVLAGGAVGLALALAGTGAWALVAQQLLTAFVDLVLLWWLSDYRPRLRFSRAVARELHGFGWRVLLNQIGVFASRRSDALVLGYFFGPAALALYRMAERLSQLVVEISTRPIAQVALPNFARLRTDRDALRRGVASAVKASSMLSIPAFVGLAMLAEPVFALLGERWHDSAAVLRILCLLGVGRAMTLQIGALLQAVGRPGLLAAMTWAHAVATALGLTLAGFWLADRSGLEQITGIAATRTAIFALLYAPPYIAMMVGFSGVGWRQLLGALQPSAVAALAVAAAVAASEALAAALALPNPLALSAHVTIGGVAAGATLYAADADFRAYAGALRRRVRRAESGS